MKLATSLSLLSKEERGYYVRLVLSRYNQSTEALATIFQVNKTTVWKWLVGKSVPAGENLKKFESILEGSVFEKPLEFYSDEEKKALERDPQNKIVYQLLPLENLKDELFSSWVYKDATCNIYNLL